MARLQWFVQPAILMPNETYPEEVLRSGLMREMSREEWEYHEAQKRREEWDKKHPKCDACGQFLGGKSHFYRDYWGEVEHV
jgi:hypothetical protein